MTISWIIERLLVKPTEGSYTDVVITADWRCNGTETTGSGDTEQTYSGTCYGSCSFAAGLVTPMPRFPLASSVIACVKVMLLLTVPPGAVYQA